jgi:DNA-binding MarR family transcriptional regulator
VIAVLGRYPELSANAVAERTAMDKVAVSRAVAHLLERGLLLREMHGDDRRRSVLALSEAGIRIYDEIVPLALGRERKLARDAGCGRAPATRAHPGKARERRPARDARVTRRYQCPSTISDAHA